MNETTCQKCRSYRQRCDAPARCFCPLEQAADILREGLTGPVTIWDRIAPNLADLLTGFHRAATFMEGRDCHLVPDSALRIARTIVEHEKRGS